MNEPIDCGYDFLGFATFGLLAALPLALALSWITLRLYRRAVRKAMNHSVGHDIAVSVADHGEGQPAAPLSFEFLDSRGGEDQTLAAPLRTQSAAALRRVSLTYAIAGAAHAAIVTALMFYFDHIEFLPVRFTATWLVYAWPIIPVLSLIAAQRRATKIWMFVAYFVSLTALDAAMHAIGTIDGPRWRMLLLWAIEMAPPTAILWLLSNRALRCIGLIALLAVFGLTAAWFGSFQTLGCLAVNTENEFLVQWLSVLRMLIVFAVGMLMWLWLRHVAIRLRRSQTSDLMLTIDSWWLLITIAEMILLASSLKSWTPILLVAFVAYRIIVGIGLKLASREAAASNAPNLLVLRVFGFARRSERLLDEVGLRWRYIGPINLIAGTDIATSFLEPYELFQFLSGRLSDAYIVDAAMLDEKLQRLNERAADGRYALNDFYCRDNSWRATVHALASRSDAVFMDLRSFRKENRGCEFELGLLLEQVPLAKITFLVDSTTDGDHLTRTLNALWDQHGGRGVNARSALPVLRLFRSEEHGAALAEALTDRLFAVAGGARGQTTASHPATCAA